MAQKNTLQYILLGLLSGPGMSGYDIKKLFNTELSDFWHANHSQIYPELRRLEAKGYVQGNQEIIGEKMTKYRYILTSSGKKLLHQWLREPLSDVPPSKDEFPIKAYLMNNRTDPDLRELLEEEFSRHEVKYAYLIRRMESLSKKEQAARYGHTLVLRRALHREKSYLAWLQEEIMLLENK